MYLIGSTLIKIDILFMKMKTSAFLSRISVGIFEQFGCRLQNSNNIQQQRAELYVPRCFVIFQLGPKEGYLRHYCLIYILCLSGIFFWVNSGTTADERYVECVVAIDEAPGNSCTG